jgi:hypothetical protein
MMRYCLVCQEDHDFNTLNDEDCNRCENCLSLPYSKVDAITLHHREEYSKRMEDKNGNVNH